jgi:hypothetical protein
MCVHVSVCLSLRGVFTACVGGCFCLALSSSSLALLLLFCYSARLVDTMWCCIWDRGYCSVKDPPYTAPAPAPAPSHTLPISLFPNPRAHSPSLRPPRPFSLSFSLSLLPLFPPHPTAPLAPLTRHPLVTHRYLMTAVALSCTSPPPGPSICPPPQGRGRGTLIGCLEMYAVVGRS